MCLRNSVLGLVVILGCAREPAPVAALPVPIGPPRAPAPSASTPAPPEVAPAPPEVALAPLAAAGCVIRDGGDLHAPLALSFRGKSFAEFERATAVEVRASGDAATASVTTADGAFVGEVRLNDLVAGQRTAALHDGWLRILRAKVERVSGERAALRPELPGFLRAAREVVAEVPCGDLGLTALAGAPAPDLGSLDARAPRVPLRRAPGGEIVAWLTPPRATSSNAHVRALEELNTIDVEELQRRGAAVQVRVHTAAVAGREAVYAEGWIDAASFTRAKPLQIAILAALGGGTSLASGAEPPAPVECPRDVPLYVEADGQVVRVGTLRKGRPVHSLPASRVDRRRVLISPSRRTDTTPFAPASALEGCVERR